MYSFDFPEKDDNIIKVMGVGGGGSNAVQNMYTKGIKGVSFVVCNTDAQALQNNSIKNKLQIGSNLTAGLGAGAKPEVGKNAAVESKKDIKALLAKNTKMLFITAGMGGGTGTGAAPIIAEIAQELAIITVGIVTLPFSFEGKKKIMQAKEGIAKLKANCDTVLVILNDRLKTIFGNLAISNAFKKADNILTTAAKSIAEIITVPGYVNVDFEDVKTVIKNAGPAVMGSGEAEGEKRSLKAAEAALSSPLLDYKDIKGAKKILLSIVSGQKAELQMDELSIITDYIEECVGNDAEVIFGHGYSDELENRIRVTVIATGFDSRHYQSEALLEKLKTTDLRRKQENISTEETKTEKEYIKNHKNLEQNELSFPLTPLEERKEHLVKQAKERIQNSQAGKSIQLLNPTQIREKYAIPAFSRKNVQLILVDAKKEKKYYDLYEN